MDQKIKREGLFPLLISLAFTVGLAVLFFVLFSASKYLLYFTFALLMTLFASVITILAVFGVRFDAHKPTKPSAEQSAEGDEAPKKIKILAKMRYTLALFFWGICVAYEKSRKVIGFISLCAVFVSFQIYFGFMLSRMTSIYKISFWHPVLFILLFVSSIILDKWCKHAKTEDPKIAALLSDLRQTFYVARIGIVLLALSTTVKLLGFAELQKYLMYVFAAIFYYVSAFILVSLAVLTVRKELWKKPKLVIPLPFFGGDTKEFGVISFLEKNTGITMRGLWSMRLIKTILPYSIIMIFALFWLSTGIVQIEPYQQGAVYRLGKLSDDVLEPGIHMTLPFPFDKVETYDTETLNKLTIGYAAKEDSDNLWTGSHGTNEHKLLLGDGNELVSVNLRIEYKIGDLATYLRASSEPARILEAQAYELITERIIDTDLDTLLSVDRAAFAEQYTEELKARLADSDVGLEITTVVLESIHPPLEIAAIYQQVIGAQIEAEAMIKMAQSDAEVAVKKAESEKNASINAANAEYHQKLADATADVSEFNASVEASDGHPEAYRYYKYLGAIAEAYSKADLVIVGDGVDSSKIYFANGNGLIIQ